MREGLIFANARARAMESRLFPTERLRRMTECKTAEDAMRILFEVNYAGGMIPEDGDFRALLREEERLATAFVKEVAPKGIGFECLFLKNDYHNLKALYKAKFSKTEDLGEMRLPDGNYRFEDLKTGFERGKIDVNEYMNAACAEINEAYDGGTGTPRIIDATLDKFMYEEISARLKKGADPYVKEYFTALVDGTNVLTYARTLRIGGNFEYFSESFMPGGNIGAEVFEKCNGDLNKLEKSLAGTACAGFIGYLEEGETASYETALDDFLSDIFFRHRADMFSAAPIFGYYLAKLYEIKVIRVVLVCIKNGIKPEEMKKRVRTLYA